MIRLFRWALMLALLVAAPGSAFAQWTEYRNEALGFQMLVPPGAKPVTRDDGGGWGSVHFQAGERTAVSALVKMGPRAPIDRIREYAVAVTRIPGDRWRRAGEPTREPAAGFDLVESWTASEGATLVVAMLGHGPRGNYAIFVSTTVAEYEKGKAGFVRWAGSIKVF